jgi:hypothetical protein
MSWNYCDHCLVNGIEFFQIKTRKENLHHQSCLTQKIFHVCNSLIEFDCNFSLFPFSNIDLNSKTKKDTFFSFCSWLRYVKWSKEKKIFSHPNDFTLIFFILFHMHHCQFLLLRSNLWKESVDDLGKFLELEWCSL